jgi:hypothetical protein
MMVLVHRQEVGIAATATALLQRQVYSRAMPWIAAARTSLPDW